MIYIFKIKMPISLRLKTTMTWMTENLRRQRSTVNVDISSKNVSLSLTVCPQSSLLTRDK